MKFGNKATLSLACALLLNGCFENKPAIVANDPKIDYQLGNYSRAFSGLYLQARQGNPEAQYAVGYMYYVGLGTDKNQDAGLEWMRLAAKRNNPKAIAALRSIVGNQNNVQDGMFESQTDATRRALKKAKQIHVAQAIQRKQQVMSTTMAPTPLPQQSGVDWIRRQNPSHYTVTFRAEGSPFQVANLAQQIKYSPINEYRLRTSGRIQYSAALGSYANIKDAQRCLDNLPPAVRQRAIVMSWSEIQTVMLP